MPDSIDQFGMLMAFMAPVVGLLAWLVKATVKQAESSSERHTEGLVKISDSVDKVNMTCAETSVVLTKHMESANTNQKEIVDLIGKVIHKGRNTDTLLGNLVEQHQPGHTLCRHGEIEAHDIHEAAKKINESDSL